MAIKPVCDKCKKELVDFGAILFSPPNKKNSVTKYHLCKKCFKTLSRFFTKGKLIRKINK